MDNKMADKEIEATLTRLINVGETFYAYSHDTTYRLHHSSLGTITVGDLLELKKLVKI